MRETIAFGHERERERESSNARLKRLFCRRALLSHLSIVLNSETWENLDLFDMLEFAGDSGLE